MRRALIVLYVAIMLIAPAPYITTPDTLGGSLLIAAIALVAVLLGALAVTGRVPRYGPEVAILAVVPLLVALMGEGAYPMLWAIPVQVVLGEQLASRSGGSARAELAGHGDEDHDHQDHEDHQHSA